jgi:shikimate dehydrogenase
VNRRLALIGDSVSHSVSPAMMRVAIEVGGLDLTYEAVRVPAAALRGTWSSLVTRFAGMNVTAPLKEAVVPLVAALSPEAAEARSVNTVVLRSGRAEGHSTDGAGFAAALDRAGVTPIRAVVLGTGGAARAVTAALRRGGTEVVVSGRNTVRRPEDLGARFVPPSAVAGELPEADLLVNATPVHGDPGPLPADAPMHPDLTVFDLVYRPRRTALLSRAEAAGCRTIEGVEMLVEQGARSFTLWTGLPAPAGAMRDAALRALAAPAPVGEPG